MPRVRKSELAFDAITLEGSLISPAKLAEVADRKASEQSDADYHIPKGLTLRDETARYFRIGQALFRELFAGNHPSQQATIRFTQELLRDVFGFADIETLTAPKVHGDRTYVVSLEALKGRVPVVVVPPSDDLDHASTHLSHDRRRSAATSLQDWLNAEDNALWGLCCNGERLRLLRDNQSLTRPAYLEANLRQIFDSEDYAGFAVLWLIIHASRFGRPDTPATDCALERWREAGSKEGLAARDRLSDGFRQALLALGDGFLSHPANAGLRDRLTGGQLPLQDFFNELLRLVYRLIFLFVAEDRGLLHAPDAPETARKIYADGYSLGALRDGAIRRSGWDQFHDRWQGLLVVFRSLAHGEPRLGLPALGGLFESHQTPDLDAAKLSNRALMSAIFRLAWLREDSSIVPVNWRDMETEELGSVYEGLLELTPRLTQDGRGFAFAEGAETKGNERKKTGSYYTPDSLVQALLDSALDPVLDRVESESQDAVSALLGLTVIDPACGSGHFLLAAARRIATRVARLRTDGVASAADFRHALRDVVRCCIHGVDRNPMAVELAKVALWIESVEPGKPLGFLDSNIRLGDSLFGIFDLKALEKGIPDAAYKPLTGDDKGTANDFLKRNRSDKGVRQDVFDFSGGGTRARRAMLPDLAASLRAVRQLPEDSVEQVETKRTRYRAAQSDPHLTNLEQAADLYVAAFLIPKSKEQSLDLHTSPVPTTDDVWKAMRAGTVYGPRLGKARQLAGTARAFHWPLEFPDLIISGGFDVVLGNPPWERIKLQEQEFFASREPEVAMAPNAAARGRMIQRLKNADSGTRERLLYEEFELAKRIAEASSEFAHLKTEDAGRFVLTGCGDVNTYALFAELFASLASERGRAGVIVPTGIACDSTTAEFFGSIITERRLVSLFDFQTGLGFFDDIGHARFKFCLLTLCARLQGPHNAEFSFFSRTIEDFNRAETRFTLSSEQIASINPNTKTAPIFRTKYDARLTAEIFQRIPILISDAQGEIGNPWGVNFARLFDMANDSGLFRTGEELSKEGYERIGMNWTLPVSQPPLPDKAQPGHLGIYDGAAAPPQTYVPLYEAKMIHQFDHRWATYDGVESRDVSLAEKRDGQVEVIARYWIPEAEVCDRLKSKEWSRNWLIGWRDICRATDERTVISAAFPKTGCADTLLLMLPSPRDIRLNICLLANLDSLILDYTTRQKIGGTHLKYNVFKQIAVLPPSAYSESDVDFILPRALELTYTSRSMAGFAHDLGYDGSPFTWDENRRAQLRAELDAWYARAYGLNRDELRYVLDPADLMGGDYPSETFRVLKSNEIRKFDKYRTRDLVLEAWDRMEAGDLPAPVPYDRNATVLDPTAAGVNPLFGAGPLFEVPAAVPVSPTRTPIDPYHLPAAAWAADSSLPAYTVTQLAAIIHRLAGPTPISEVRLASLLALEPHLLTRHLQDSERKVWLNLVGNAAQPPSTSKVVVFASKINAAWGKAVTQLRGMGEIREDIEAGTWSEGSPTSQYQIPEWADGRAYFALKGVAGISFDVLTAGLSSEDRAWVNMANVA